MTARLLMRRVAGAVAAVAFFAFAATVNVPASAGVHPDPTVETAFVVPALQVSSPPATAVTRGSTPVIAQPSSPASLYRYTHPNGFVERWHAVALAAGWSEAQWPRLSCIIQRESHGIPTVWNRHDPGYGSLGLTQVNMGKGRWGTWALYRARLGGQLSALLDPMVNLQIAHDLYLRAARMWGNGWRPWGPGRC